jgi:Domain of unknown function (DUF4304)
LHLRLVSEIGLVIAQIAEEALAAPLKRAGFTKSGRTWRRWVGEAAQVIHVQASRSNAGANGRFVLAAGVYFPALADRLGLFPPNDAPTEPDCHVRARPMPPGRRWWKVRAAGVARRDPDAKMLGALFSWLDRRADRRAEQTNALASRELREAMERYAMPWLDRTGTLAGARDELVRTGPLWWAAAASLELGDYEAARRLFQQDLARATPDRADKLRRWGRANRLES